MQDADEGAVKQGVALGHKRQVAKLEQRVDLRESQLAALENLILARELKEEIHPEGRPVQSGFISSYFGEREDPFDGQETFHKGVDFAGTKGSTVMAVAAGVVTWAGERSGFGKLIEIAIRRAALPQHRHQFRHVADQAVAAGRHCLRDRGRFTYRRGRGVTGSVHRVNVDARPRHKLRDGIARHVEQQLRRGRHALMHGSQFVRIDERLCD